MEDAEESWLRDLPPEVAAEVRRNVERDSAPLGPRDPRRHHFLPQFYLRRFADKDERIGVRPLGERGPHVTHVTNAAVIADFYTVVGNDELDTAVVEKTIGHLEEAVKPAIERLALGVLFPPQPRDRMYLAFWLALQFIRDPHSRRQQEAMADAWARMHFSEVSNADTARTHLRNRDGFEPTDEAVAALLEGVRDATSWEIVVPQNNLVDLMMRGAHHLAPYFFTRRWCVVRLPTPGLVTTDRPVVLVREGLPPGEGLGVATAQEILFPLDRQNLLILHEYPDIGEHLLPAPETMTVAQVNEILVYNARVSVFAHPDDLQAVEGMTFADPDEPLIRVGGDGWAGPWPPGVNSPSTRRQPRRYRESRGLPDD